MTIQKTSWGYIRNTDISGYLTIEELLNELVTTVRYINNLDGYTDCLARSFC